MVAHFGLLFPVGIVITNFTNMKYRKTNILFTSKEFSFFEIIKISLKNMDLKMTNFALLSEGKR